MGIPADLITRRPDIKAAERRYRAAVAKTSVAKACKYPRLRLGGTFFLSANQATDLPVFEDAFMAVIAAITLPLAGGFFRRRTS